MNETPLRIKTRPFAIEPNTHVMLPDGTFDNALHELIIACHVTNTSGADLTEVMIYLEGVSDPGVAVLAHTHHLARIPAGTTVLLEWSANFENAVPGKPLLSVVASAKGFASSRSLQRIHVSQTRYDPIARTFSCSVPEGTLTLRGLRGVRASAEWMNDVDTVQGECERNKPWGPLIPTGFRATWAPNPAFEGEHGQLPFGDPWWKILAIIVAIVAAIVGVVGAALGSGKFGLTGKAVEEGSDPDPHVKCCTPMVRSKEEAMTVGGIASTICAGAIITACSDEADPWWRGQSATLPTVGAKTLSEDVEAWWSLPEAPTAGIAYVADVDWTYTRVTTGGSQTYSASERQTNTHRSDGVIVRAASPVSAMEPLVVEAQFLRAGGDLFRGPELYAFCAFRSPNGIYFVRPLSDDGLSGDSSANDGTYVGGLPPLWMRKTYANGVSPEGTWRVFVFAQEVNLTIPGSVPPHIAAQTIGGAVIASSLSITFDESLPCPLRAQATIEVV